MPAALKSSSVAPQFEHAVTVAGFFVPHFGQVISALIVVGLKHMGSPPSLLIAIQS